jgi:hypothetical protein
MNNTGRTHGVATLAHATVHAHGGYANTSSNKKNGLPLDALNCALDSLADADASYALTARPVQRLIKVLFQ